MTDGTAGDGTQVRVAAIVLAAGGATRMGVQKVLLPVDGRPMVARVVDAALGSKAVEVVTVVGHEATRTRAALEGRALTVVHNLDHGAGMSTSLRVGLQALREPVDGAVFLLADQPFVTSALVDRLIDRFSQTRPPVVRPVVGGRPANPVLMSAALFPEILAQGGDVGGREIVELHQAEVVLVPVDEPRAVADIDTPDDYRAAGGRA